MCIGIYIYIDGTPPQKKPTCLHCFTGIYDEENERLVELTKCFDRGKPGPRSSFIDLSSSKTTDLRDMALTLRDLRVSKV